MHKAVGYANALFFLLYVTRAFYRRIRGARFALLVPQSVNFTIGITFLADEKRPLNNTSAGCTRPGRQPLGKGCNRLFYKLHRN